MKSADESWEKALLRIISLLNDEGVAYTVSGETALRVQGIQVPDPPDKIQILIQWDAADSLHEKLQKLVSGDVLKNLRHISFCLNIDHFTAELTGEYGTVIRTDPDRIVYQLDGSSIYVRSPYYFLNRYNPEDSRYRAVKHYLRRIQQTDSGENRLAWNEEAFQAWVRRFGSPEQAAEKIRRDPTGRLAQLAPYIHEVRGKKVINLLGSHGGKALALALLGAQVTVVDISAENAEYARQTAAALDLPLKYIVCDVLQLPDDEKTADYDFVIMELGILHYFVDLDPLAKLVRDLLKPGGQLILQEFHPVSTKLVTTHGKKQVVFGNYFDPTLRTREVAYSKHLNAAETQDLKSKVYLREWTLGEIVTSFARSGLRITRLDEQPNMKISDIGLPKLFTLICTK
ncbi:class I SAM-dependent methyltransferase [Sporolactobacillus vineae]|uniref:class I SAM-dependent methyltransferase n=1 Tax=Sporolactobacillus vineae TaxID=444463 RepID=UPI000288F2B0|nr:class I SAM-dependent methyltransferase [Sporolactobacillus vineae]